jgi:Peptidase family M23/Transglycosylase-like domain
VFVKVPLLVVVLLAGGLLGIPVVIGGNGSSSAATCGELAVVLDTIRTIESGGDYAAGKNQGGASGAYQYVDSTWSAYEGYESAYLAPPEVQDARATSDVQEIFATYGDLAFVPVVWYWPKAASDPAQLDIVPMAAAGNRLTVREYQQKWLELYQLKLDAGSTSPCSGAVATDDGYALPLDRTLIAANPTVLDQPHHDYPAIDLMVPEGSPVYAVRGGTVARVVDWPHNCYQYGRCDQTCGVGVSIEGDDDARYIYCHGTRLNGVDVGEAVAAGQLLMWSGNTGRSGAPHLHFEIRVSGEQRCPQRLLVTLFDAGAAPQPSSLEPAGCSF